MPNARERYIAYAKEASVQQPRTQQQATLFLSSFEVNAPNVQGFSRHDWAITSVSKLWDSSSSGHYQLKLDGCRGLHPESEAQPIKPKEMKIDWGPRERNPTDQAYNPWKTPVTERQRKAICKSPSRDMKSMTPAEWPPFLQIFSKAGAGTRCAAIAFARFS
jgi:hypothetical protein